MHYVNAWPKRCIFNLDLNRESLSHEHYQEGLGAKCENALPPLVDLDILGTTRSPEFCDLKERDGL